MADLNEIKVYLQNLNKNVNNANNVNSFNYSNKEFSEALGMKDPSVSRKILSKTKVKEKQIDKLENFYNVDLSIFRDKTTNNKKSFSKITRIDIKGSCGKGQLLLNEPEISYLMLDNNLIKRILKTKPENLYIIQATGDSMEDAGIYEGDILLIDKSKIDPQINGIYLFTTQNNEYVFIKRLRYRLDGILEVISANKQYETLFYSNADLSNLDFSIKGRIIKNLSRGI